MRLSITMDEQSHSESARGIHYHNVTVLLSDNVTKRNDQVFMPNTIVMASIKKKCKGQFVNNVKFTVNMSEEDVKRTLLSHFPNLKNQRFFCASVVDNRTRLEFHGEKSVWDGEFMKKTLQGNSALYIFTEMTDSEWSKTLPQRPTVHKQCENQVRSGKKSGKRKNDESAPAAKRAKECHAIKWYPVNMVQFKPQGHPSTSKVTTVQSSQNVYENQSSRATYFKKNSTPVTHTITSSTFVPGQQTQASGGTLPSSAHTLVSLLSSPHLNLQTSVQGCQSQLIRQRQYHFCQDDLTVGKDIFDSSQLGNRIPVTNLPEHGKQIQTGLDQQHVLQNKSSLLLRTSQSAGSSIASRCGGTSLHSATQQRRGDQEQSYRPEVVPEVPYQLRNISYCTDGPVFAFPIIGSKYGLTASEPSPSQRLASTCLADNTAGSQVSLNTQALGASFMEQAGDQISQNVQTSGASLIQPGILHIDPSQQPAATVDQQPISHESPSGLDSIRNSTIGVAVASDTAEQSGATSETDPSQQTAVTTDREPIKNESDSSQDAIMNNTVGVAQASDSAYHSEDLCTPSEIFGFSGQSDSVLEEGKDVFFELLTPTGVVKQIFPATGQIQEIIPFCITLREELPKEYKKLNLKANFEGVDTVPLEIENGKTLTGNIVSNKIGKVKVSVEYDGSDGRSIGYTDFTFTVNAQAILGEIVLVKRNQKLLFDALGKTPGIEGTSGGDPQEAASRGAAMGAGSSNLNKRSDALSIRVLTLLLYKAAELDGYEFLEMVFSTSAGKVVFKHYKNNSTLPEDVARANGHAILGDFLENVNKRLAVEAGNEDSSETINWLELKHAAEKDVCLPGTDDAQSVDSPGGDMNQSGYEADDEVSPLPSPADTDAIGSEMDDSQHESSIHADSGQITLDKNDSLGSIATEAERQRHQIGNNQQAGSGSSFTNRDDSEEEIEPSPHGTDNVEKNSAQESSAGDCAGLIPDWAYTEEKRELEILFLDPLPDDVISYKADFEGLGVANLIRKNSYTLVGYNPSKGKMPLNHFATGIENGITALKKGGQQEHTLQSNQGERDDQCATEAEKGRTGSLNGIVVEEKQKFGGFTSGSGGSDCWSYLKSWLPFQDNSDNCSDNGNLSLNLSGIGSFDITIDPPEISLKGGGPCHFLFIPDLPSDISSGTAKFFGLHQGFVKLKGVKDEADFLVGRGIPSAEKEGWVTVGVVGKNDKTGKCNDLGQTKIYYFDERRKVLKQIVQNEEQLHDFFETWKTAYEGHSTAGRVPKTESPSSGPMDSGNPLHSLQGLMLLVYTAAETDARQFIELIFNSSAGRLVFNAYRCNSPLPEDVARAFGHEDTAQYLESISKRLSEDLSVNEEDLQASHILELAEAVKNQSNYKVNYNQEAVTSSPDEVTNVASHLQEGTVTGSHRSKRVPGVYGFVKDLILEGEHAKFVDDNGRYWINWLTAPGLYHKFRAKNYPKLSSECNQKAARKTLSAALIDSFKSQGAVEYDEYKKVNIKNGQVLERQFQMPPRIFESLFGSDYSGGFVSAEPETSEISLSDPEVTQVVGDIFPSPGHVKGGCPLQLTTESDTTGVARFDGEDVLSEKTNSYSFLSCIPDVQGKSMVSSRECTAEQLNYYRICYIGTDILSEGLRTIFKQEWDNRYATTLGEWKDEVKNGMDFWNGETPQSRDRNSRLLTIMKKGDRAEWDCTMLFYAILHSDCIKDLDPVVYWHVNDLRIFRDEEFPHMPRGYLSSRDFRNAILKAKAAFLALGLPTLKLHEIQYHISFPTEELRSILKQIDDLRHEVQDKDTKLQEKGIEFTEKDKEPKAKENQRHTLQELSQTEVSLFPILPPFDVAPCEYQAREISQYLKALQGSELNRAGEYHDRASGIHLEERGAKHPDVAMSNDNLGLTHRQLLSELNQTKEYHDCRLAIPPVNLRAKDRDDAICYDKLGLLYRELGKLRLAKVYHELAPDIRLKELAPQHIDFATSYDNLSLVQNQLGDLKQEKDLHERALDIRLKKLGPHHVDIAMSYFSLGVIHHQLGDLKEAMDFHERALDIRLKRLGAQHVDSAMSYVNLGHVHRQLGDLKQAKDCYKHALVIRSNKLGPYHVDIATSYDNLGLVESQLGDLKQAKDCLQHALDIRLKVLGPEHVDVAMSYDNLGLVQSQLGDLT